MATPEEIMRLFIECGEKHELVSKLLRTDTLAGYNYSELHTLAAIGELASPNVTEIAKRLKLTRGAITKLTQRLMSQGLIEAYKQDGNRQKIFFRLTDAGQKIFAEHAVQHQKQHDDIAAFLARFPADEQAIIAHFCRKWHITLRGA